MTTEILTQEKLKEFISYDSDTGILTWIKRHPKANNIKVGDIISRENDGGYIVVSIGRRIYRAHRLAFLYMEGEFPPHDIDHIDHDRTNNKWDNLRCATRSENHKNRSLWGRNKSGVLGVDKLKDSSVWRARISHNKKVINLGRFSDKFEAICARKSAEIRYDYHKNHGDAT